VRFTPVAGPNGSQPTQLWRIDSALVKVKNERMTMNGGVRSSALGGGVVEEQPMSGVRVGSIPNSTRIEYRIISKNSTLS